MNIKVKLTERGIEHFLNQKLYNPDNLPLESLVGAGLGTHFLNTFNFPVAWIDRNGGCHFFWTLAYDEVEEFE